MAQPTQPPTTNANLEPPVFQADDDVDVTSVQDGHSSCTRIPPGDNQNATNGHNNSVISGAGAEPEPHEMDQHEKVLTVADVAKRPMEEEAETRILESLEREEKESKERGDDDGRSSSVFFSAKPASMFSAVPDDAVHLFDKLGGSRESNSVEDFHNEDESDIGRDPEAPKVRFEEEREPLIYDEDDLSARERAMEFEFSNLSSGGRARDRERIAPTLHSFRGLTSRLRLMQMGRDDTKYLGSDVHGANAGDDKNLSGSDDEMDNVHPGAPGATPISGADELFDNAHKVFRQSMDNTDIEAQGGDDKTEDSVHGDNMKGTSVKNVDNSKLDGATVDPADESSASRLPPRRPLVCLRIKRKLRRFKELLIEENRPRKKFLKKYTFHALIGVIFPCLTVSAVLFYAIDNPLTCEGCASWSWWIIFIGIRQLCTFTLARLCQMIFVDICCLRTTVTQRIWGPLVTLAFIQSRGWPYLVGVWALIDVMMLYGDGSFANHWLYYQSAIKMCNAENPSGDVINTTIYALVIVSLLVASVMGITKRVWLSYSLGKRSYIHYGPQLERIFRQILLISEVAKLAKEIETNTCHIKHDDDPKNYGYRAAGGKYAEHDITPAHIFGLDGEEENSGPEDEQESDQSLPTFPHLGNNTTNDKGSNSKSSQKVSRNDQTDARPQHRVRRMEINELLGEWEEPEIKTSGSMTHQPTVQDILQFRQAVSYMDGDFPFSIYFGNAKTREECIASAQTLYTNLLLLTREYILSFDTLALVAIDEFGNMDRAKAKELIKIFRPDRKGKLSKLDFVRSIDSVYKSLRLFRAGFANNSQIDLAFEELVNVFFYFVLFIVCLTIVRLDVWTFFVSITGLLVSFAFCFGNASSMYFEGLLLIFVRRPYDIGDRVAISNVENATSADGEMTWFVEGVTLYTTTMRYAVSNEVATYSNGSIARSRIINAARSPNAQIFVSVKFGHESPPEKIKIFKSIIEKYVKSRPREWVQLGGFRAKRIEPELGFVEYELTLVHRENWQNLGVVLDSKSNIQAFAVEVSKKLELKYEQPSLPVSLGLRRELLNQGDVEPVASMAEHISRKFHENTTLKQ